MEFELICGETESLISARDVTADSPRPTAIKFGHRLESLQMLAALVLLYSNLQTEAVLTEGCMPRRIIRALRPKATH